jgi:hypothetical protein
VIATAQSPGRSLTVSGRGFVVSGGSCRIGAVGVRRVAGGVSAGAPSRALKTYRKFSPYRVAKLSCLADWLPLCQQFGEDRLKHAELIAPRIA